MIAEKIKIRVSDFVSCILENDAQVFGFLRNGDKSNINGLLNRLIPILYQLRKERLEETRQILKKDFRGIDAEKVYFCVNDIINRVYFSDEELDCLRDEIWIRPTKQSTVVFDEIAEVATRASATELSVYIRGLLNEYVRVPQYKREAITFTKELDNFAEASVTGQIYHCKYKEKSLRMFAYKYYYGYSYHQENYLIGYDITNRKVRAFSLHDINNGYLVKQTYKPSDTLIKTLEEYADTFDFEAEIDIMEEQYPL